MLLAACGGGSSASDGYAVVTKATSPDQVSGITERIIAQAQRLRAGPQPPS